MNLNLILLATFFFTNILGMQNSFNQYALPHAIIERADVVSSAHDEEMLTIDPAPVVAEFPFDDAYQEIPLLSLAYPEVEQTDAPEWLKNSQEAKNSDTKEDTIRLSNGKKKGRKIRNPGIFQCEDCSKIFAWTWGLVEHKKYACKANKEIRRGFPCTIKKRNKQCHYIGKRESDLRVHMKLPHPLKRIKIPKGLTKIITTEGSDYEPDVLTPVQSTKNRPLTRSLGKMLAASTQLPHSPS